MRRMFAMALVVGLAAGCGTGSGENKSGGESKQKGHEHPTEGPHHGALVEWEDEDYHIEVLADRGTGVVTAYVLGRDAKTAAPIGSDKLVLAIKDPAVQVELKPTPEATDPKGKSSKFVGTLPEATKGRKLEGTIGGKVDGKPYSGEYSEKAVHKD